MFWYSQKLLRDMWVLQRASNYTGTLAGSVAEQLPALKYRFQVQEDRMQLGQKGDSSIFISVVLGLGRKLRLWSGGGVSRSACQSRQM